MQAVSSTFGRQSVAASADRCVSRSSSGATSRAAPRKPITSPDDPHGTLGRDINEVLLPRHPGRMLPGSLGVATRRLRHPRLAGSPTET